MTALSWNSIADQLRSIGVKVPEDLSSSDYGRQTPANDISAPPALANVVSFAEEIRGTPPQAEPSDAVPDVIDVIVKAARSAGVTFFERVNNGELVAEGLGGLAPNVMQSVQAKWLEIRSALLPPHTPTASLELLSDLGVELHFVDTETAATEQLERLCGSGGPLGLDLETSPRSEFLPVLWPIAITKDGRRSMVQPVMDASAGLDPFRAEIRLLQIAAEIDGRAVSVVIDIRGVPITSPALEPLWKCRLIGHNLSFDAKMLLAHGIEIPDENILDTILMSGLVLRGQPNKHRPGSRRPSLADAVKECLQFTLPKTSQLSPWWRDRLTDEQIAYAALDPVIALKLANCLQPRVDQLRPGPDEKSLCDRLCRAVMPVARMELAGVSLDQNALSRQVEAWDGELALLRTELEQLGITNPASGPQLISWLRREFQRLDEETGSSWESSWPRTPTGALSTTAKHLGRLVEAIPDAGVLVRHSQLAQLTSNFGNKLLARVSSQPGRLHGNFLIAMAKSGRFSSSNPNLQNIPRSREMRSLFVAAPGRMLVVADYSQLELRVMAEIAGDEVMTEAYRKGLDLHAMTASGLLGIRPEEFDQDNPAHKTARQKAKAVNFGVIFGSGPRGLQEFARDAYGLVMSVTEAQTLIDAFLGTYPGVASWQRGQDKRCFRARSVSTVGGRIYRFGWEPHEKYARNLALNLPVQGTAAEIAVEAVIRIDQRLRQELPGRAQLVLQVHDEFVVEVENDEDGAVSSAKEVLELEMAAALLAPRCANHRPRGCTRRAELGGCETCGMRASRFRWRALMLRGGQGFRGVRGGT
jgi:DNA polymerase I-like protein with 3'-5' exonuclease and polymerase domains